MTDLGKIDHEFFERVIASRLGATRDDVLTGPQHGIDFGVLSVGGSALVAATDPISVLPDLGVDRAAGLALDIVLTDVAVSGIPPTHAAITLTLPPSMTDQTIAAIWRGFDRHASALDVALVASHVSRERGVDSSWVGGATGFGVGDTAAVVRPDGARPGDAIVVSTGPGAEIAGLASTLYPDRLDVSAGSLAAAQDRVDDITGVRDAVTIHDAGRVTAMHDATEGGIQAGLVEMATRSGVRFDVESEAVPVRDGVEPVCGALGVDPWQVTSCGTLLSTVSPADADAVLDALDRRDTPAAVVGTVSDGDGVYVDGQRVTAPDRDPSWAAIEALTE